MTANTANNPNPRSRRTTIDLDAELLAAIDAARGDEPRNAWIARAARLLLQANRGPARVEPPPAT
jgi:hypothetical protein